MSEPKDHVFFATRAELRTWLGDNQGLPVGVWAVFYKKSTGLSDMSWEVLVEECLCFGWIDSLPGKVDEVKTKIYISPRKVNSGWSRRNKLILPELEANGLMTDAGRAVIERAKSNGSWERFDLAEALVVPEELQTALTQDNAFGDAWGLLTESKKRQFLQQIYDAKTFETRQKRIATIRAGLCE
jgi:uncharacterized protein YdeI (YjbR/CyaY-like superfamily)